jgi:hypothetical protein
MVQPAGQQCQAHLGRASQRTACRSLATAPRPAFQGEPAAELVRQHAALTRARGPTRWSSCSCLGRPSVCSIEEQLDLAARAKQGRSRAVARGLQAMHAR